MVRCAMHGIAYDSERESVPGMRQGSAQGTTREAPELLSARVGVDPAALS